MMNEIWKDIKGYEGLYQVSNFGNVKSLSNNFSRKEKIFIIKCTSTTHCILTMSNIKYIEEAKVGRSIQNILIFIKNPLILNKIITTL